MAVHDLPSRRDPAIAARDGADAVEISVGVDRYPGVTVLRLSGVHDLTTSNDLLRPINDAIQAGDVVVDLNGADFIDSSVIHVLIGGRRAAVAADRLLRLSLVPGHPLRRVLEITNTGIEVVDHTRVVLDPAEQNGSAAADA